MMTSPKPKRPGLADFASLGADLHADPLVSTAELLQLLGAYAMQLTRWKRERGMPREVRHGKYSLKAILKWVAAWKVQLEEELERTKVDGKEADPTAKRLSEIRLEREELELAELKRERIAKYEEAEAQRAQMVIAVLAGLPERLISEGLLTDDARARTLELIGEAVDVIQSNIRNGSY